MLQRQFELVILVITRTPKITIGINNGAYHAMNPREWTQPNAQLCEFLQVCDHQGGRDAFENACYQLRNEKPGMSIRDMPGSCCRLATAVIYVLLLDLAAGNFLAGTSGYVDPFFRIAVGGCLTCACV